MSKKILLLSGLLLIISALLKIPATRASSDSDQIPSDLSLDLNLAEQNPAPEQKQIVSSQTPQAKIVTDQGEGASLVVKPEIPSEVKLQPAKEAENPQQTTSEQVVTKTVEETNPGPTPTNEGQAQPSASPSDTSNNPAASPVGDFIPGTNILEPDDNSAPALPTASANPSAQPNQGQGQPQAAPSSGSDNSTSSPQPANSSGGDNNQPAASAADTSQTPSSTSTSAGASTPPANSGSNAIPLENGGSSTPPPAQNSQPENSNPQPASNQTNTAPAANNNSGSDNSPSQSSSSNDSGASSGGGDSSSNTTGGVQGVAIQPTWWQLLLMRIKLWK